MSDIPDAELDGLVNSCKPEQLPRLCGALDGQYDALDSDPSRMWLQTHLWRPLRASIIDHEDETMWQCGYVFWDMGSDWTDWVREWRLVERVRDEEDIFCRYRREWHDEEQGWLQKEINLLERQKEDIYEAGGRGYWPRGGGDFSRIEGLSKEDEQRLFEEWNMSKREHKEDASEDDEDAEEKDEQDEKGET
jgi:hypothetical protein